MKWLLLFIAAGFVFSSCSNLPQVRPAGDLAAKARHSCPNPFPAGKWQFVHSIEAAMPGGRSVFVTGVVVISSVERSFRCAIMTLEGLAVFEAEWDRELTVNRAIAPFDAKPFAQGMVEDIRLLFLQPSGSPLESGFLANGNRICRYVESDGGVVDVASEGNGDWEIRRYTRDFRLLRTVNMAPEKKADHVGMPKKIELTAHGSEGYKLIMDLIEAVPLDK